MDLEQGQQMRMISQVQPCIEVSPLRLLELHLQQQQLQRVQV